MKVNTLARYMRTVALQNAAIKIALLHAEPLENIFVKLTVGHPGLDPGSRD
jgi:hypothetical protein